MPRINPEFCSPHWFLKSFNVLRPIWMTDTLLILSQGSINMRGIARWISSRCLYCHSSAPGIVSQEMCVVHSRDSQHPLQGPETSHRDLLLLFHYLV